MKPLILTLAGFLLAFFAVEVKASRYRGGTVSYRPRENSPYSVNITYRLSFRRGAVYCDGSRVANRQLASTSFSSRWQVTRYWYSGYSSSSSSGSANIYCTDFNVEEDWSEGNNSFSFTGGYSDDWWIVKITDGGDWISGITHSNPYNITLLNARVNTTVSGVFNNSSPVSSLPLTVYVVRGIPSVIRIPVEDPDGDVVRCRNASYQECYRGMCTYFPYGALDEANCTISYNGSGSVGQLFPIILKLEDFPSGTTQFDSSNSFGSVDLQFVVHIKQNASVRIQGGGSSGRLQVFHNGVWGTVCDDGWTMTNTHVVCRQLGFTRGLSYRNAGGGTGQIWLDEVRCSGRESSIQNCSHNGWGRHDCSHSEDVFVTCEPKATTATTATPVTARWVTTSSSGGGTTQAIAKETNCWQTSVSIHYTVGPATTTVTQTDAKNVMKEVLNHGTRQLSCSGLTLKLLAVTIATPSNLYVVTGKFGVVYGNMNSTQKQTARSCLMNVRIFNDIILRPDYYTSPLKGQHWSTRASLTNYQETICCSNGLASFNGTCGGGTTTSPGGGTTAAPGGGTTAAPGGGTTSSSGGGTTSSSGGGTTSSSGGGTTSSSGGGTTSSSGRGTTSSSGGGTTSSSGGGTTSSSGGGTTYSSGGGTTSSSGGGTTATPGVGTTQANLKTSVTCGENFLQIDLKDQYFPGLDYRSLHLKNTSCKATKTSYTMRLQTPLDGCGTTYVEHDKKIVFWNEVRNEKGWFGVGNLSAITRYENLAIPFYCEYGREKLVSTSFSPSKKTVSASDGSYGNFTFAMDLYQTSRYSTPYSIFAYPVVVYPNQPLWVQYEVKNTNADLVVFAENCRATTTTNPDSYPQHVFLERGCVRDSTMIYSHNPYSSVQRFSIRSFRFVYSNTFLVYLHCELLVCHRNTTNSRCTRGCISSRGRRETDDMDSSQLYGLSAGPLKGPNTKTGNDKNSGAESSQSTTVTIGAVSGLAVVALLVAILLAVKMLYNRRNTPVVSDQITSPPAIVMHQTVNSYEQHVMENDEQVEVEI